MALTQKAARELLADISDKFDISLEKLYKVAGERVKRIDSFTPKARELARENNLDAADIAHSGEKITLDDVRAALGEKKKARESDAFTAKARILARENDLSENDFPVGERSGKTRKTGTVEISVADVRKKLGIVKDSPKAPPASPKALEIAEDLGIDIRKVKGSGKSGRVLKSDIEEYIKSKKDESSDSESSDSEEE